MRMKADAHQILPEPENNLFPNATIPFKREIAAPKTIHRRTQLLSRPSRHILMAQLYRFGNDVNQEAKMPYFAPGVRNFIPLF